MSLWSQKRKNSVILVIVAMILIPVAIVAFMIIYKPATCMDGKQNQNERGVDCGGACDLICRDDAVPPVILWERVFKVADGVYTASAYIQNPNLSAGAKNVPYRLRMYDADGVSILERMGTVDIHPKYSFPIIEPSLSLGDRIPTRVTFEFLEAPVWYRMSDDLLPVVINDEVIYNQTTLPRVEAILENKTVKRIDNVPVAVVVYDRRNNAIAVSKTIVETVQGSGSTKVVFTWPEPFSTSVLRTEIIILR
jgi:hypothetical protein